MMLWLWLMWRLLIACISLIGVLCYAWFYIPWYSRRVAVGYWHSAWDAWNVGDEELASCLYLLGDETAAS